jgi:hypothetical protein
MLLDTPIGWPWINTSMYFNAVYCGIWSHAIFILNGLIWNQTFINHGDDILMNLEI